MVLGKGIFQHHCSENFALVALVFVRPESEPPSLNNKQSKYTKCPTIAVGLRNSLWSYSRDWYLNVDCLYCFANSFAFIMIFLPLIPIKVVNPFLLAADGGDPQTLGARRQGAEMSGLRAWFNFMRRLQQLHGLGRSSIPQLWCNSGRFSRVEYVWVI